MAKYISISKVAEYRDQPVVLKGWINHIRISGKVSFIELRDGSGFLQAVVAPNDCGAEKYEQIKTLKRESSIKLEGLVKGHPRKAGVFELLVTDFEILHIAEEFPIGAKEHGVDFLLNYRHLWLRSKKQWAIQNIRNTIIQATFAFFYKNGFTKIDTPIITSNACEGGTTLFEMEYFDLGKVYLAQSGQLYLESAIASHGRVFDFGPVFRAEKSKSKKHLTEFWMMDAEMAFFSHDDNLKIQEELIYFIIQEALEKNTREFTILERDTSKLADIKLPFPRITHAELVGKLRELGSEITEEIDLGRRDEELLPQLYDQPLFIEKWPAKIKAFYMKRYRDEPQYALAADLMAPEGYGEIIGGSEREIDYDKLVAQMKKEDIPLEEYQFYLDLRKYGTVQHSGFGYGLERLTAWIAGTPHIRETIPFPRMIYRCKP